MAENLGGGPKINVDVDGNADSLADVLGQIVDNFGDELNALTRKFSHDLKAAFGGGGGAAASFAKQSARNINRVAEALHDVTTNMHATDQATKGFGRSLDSALDPASFDGFKAALNEIFKLQAKLDLGPGVLGEQEFANVEAEFKLRNAALLAQRVALSKTQEAANEEAANRERNARQVSRTEIQESRAATSRAVVDAQTKAAAARDAARKRIAYVQAATRVIASLERGLSNVFRQTARVFSSAFRGAATAVSGIANGIGRAFTRTTTNIRNSVSNSNSEVSRSYKKTFGDTTNTVRNETRQQTSIINNFAREAKSSLGAIGSGVGVGFGAAVGGILGIGAAKAFAGGFERATTLENSERALTKLLSSAEKAKTLLTEVTEVVTGTPFRLDQFAQGATQLLAFNVEAEKIPEVLRTISDASALSLDPDQTVDRLIRTFGQISAAGKLTTEDINQLTEAGVPAWALLGNQIGKTVEEMRDLVSDGAVPAEQAIDLLLNGIQNGTEGVNDSTVAFAGLSKELGGTLSGSLANFNTAISRLGANIITAFKEPAVAALQAGTAAIDLLGSALKTLAITVKESLAVQLLQRAFEGLAQALKEAKGTLAPLFQVIADGVVILGQFAAAIFVLRRVPGVFKLIGLSIGRILTPMNLLIGASILIVGLFKRVYDSSGSLREAIATLKKPVDQILTSLKLLGEQVLKVVSTAIEDLLTPAVTFLSVKLRDFLLPLIEKLATFLTDKVLPAIRKFAAFVRFQVLPLIGTAFAKAVDFVRAALGKLVDFITGPVANIFGELIRFVRVAFEIITQGGTTLGADGWLGYNGPVVKGLFAIRRLLKQVAEFFRAAVTVLWKGDEYTEGTGWLSEDGLVIKGLVNIREAMESTVNFIKTEYIPVLAALGAAFAVFSLSGSIPIAGLVGLTTGLVVALSDEKIRNALADTIGKGLVAAREKINTLFDGIDLGAIGAGALKVAYTIGKTIADALTDPRLIKVVAIAAGIAAAFAGAFLLGVGEGIVSNIPGLIDLLGEALNKAFVGALKTLSKNKLLGSIILAAFTGSLILGKVVQSGRKIGETFQASVAKGMSAKNFAAQGGGLGTFTSALFGGAGTIDKQVKAEYRRAEAVVLAESARLQRIAKQATGSNLTDKYGNQLLGIDTKAIQKEFGKMETSIGSTRTAAATLRVGLRDLSKGEITAGLKSVKDGVKTIGPEIGRTAGAIAGGAFAIAFVTQALFDIDSSGTDKLQAGIGLISAGAGTFAAAGGGVQGGVAATAAVGIGLLTAKFKANKEAAAQAAAKVDEYAESIRNASKEELPDLFADTVKSALESASTDVKDDLAGVNFEYEKFAEAVRTGNVAEEFGNIEYFAGLSNGALSNLAFGADYTGASLTKMLYDSGVRGSDLNAVLDVLVAEMVALQAAQAEVAAEDALFDGAGVGRVGRGSVYARENMEALAGSTDVAKAATQAYKDKLNELNEQRLDGLRNKVSEARTVLDEAGQAADTAKEKLRQFLAGENVQQTAEQQVNNAIIAVDGIAKSVGELNIDGIINDSLNAVDTATLSNKVIEVQGLAAGLLVDIDPTDPEAAANAVAPIKTAVQESGVPQAVKDALLGGIDAAVEAANSQDGTDLFTGLFDAEQFKTDAQTALDGAELQLEVGLTLPAELFTAGWKDELGTAFTEAGTASSDGFVAGFDGEAMKTKAKDAADAALAEAKLALGIASPSTEFESIGRWTVIGFAKGINEHLGVLELVGADMGTALRKGLDPEGDGEYLGFLDAGRDAGYAFGDGTANVGVVSSLYDRGRQLVKAVLHGIDPETQGEFLAFFDAGKNAGYAFASGLSRSKEVIAAAGRSAAKAASDAIKTELDINSPSRVMEDLGRGTMAGFAKGITESAALVSDAATGAVQGALDAANSDVNVNFSGGTAQSVASRYSATADTVPYGASNMKAMTDADIQSLARAIAAESKPNVQIDQTFNKPVDSRALATDVAWRLT